MRISWTLILIVSVYSLQASPSQDDKKRTSNLGCKIFKMHDDSCKVGFDIKLHPIKTKIGKRPHITYRGGELTTLYKPMFYSYVKVEVTVFDKNNPENKKKYSVAKPAFCKFDQTCTGDEWKHNGIKRGENPFQWGSKGACGQMWLLPRKGIPWGRVQDANDLTGNFDHLIHHELPQFTNHIIPRP